MGMWRLRDPPLTDVGQEQAKTLLTHSSLTSLRRPLTVVVSPLQRTLETAVLGFGTDCRFIANSDLQETTVYPCDMGFPQQILKDDFPSVDFSELDDAWVEKEEPLHHATYKRLDRFLHWCAALPHDEVACVTHQNVCCDLTSVMLNHCDVVGVTLNRSTLEVSPLIYDGSNPGTLRMTAQNGGPDGIRCLLASRAESPAHTLGLDV